jgi:hypothetical protein
MTGGGRSRGGTGRRAAARSGTDDGAHGTIRHQFFPASQGTTSFLLPSVRVQIGYLGNAFIYN